MINTPLAAYANISLGTHLEIALSLFTTICQEQW